MLVRLQVNRTVNSSHLEMSQIFTESWGLSECGFTINRLLGLSTACCFWANPIRFLNLFLIQILSFWFSFLERHHDYIIRGNFPWYCILYHVIDWFNKISFPFCTEDVGNCRTSLNLVFSLFLFCFLVRAINDYSLVLMFSIAWDSNTGGVWLGENSMRWPGFQRRWHKITFNALITN